MNIRMIENCGKSIQGTLEEKYNLKLEVIAEMFFKNTT